MEKKDIVLSILLSMYEEANIQTVNVAVEKSTSKTIIRSNVDKKLKFEKYIENTCQKASG